MIYIDLIYNLSLLVALSVISGFIENRWNRNTRLGVLMQGALFGGVAILGMLRPLNLAAGLLFDGRSIMLSICALFFGPLAATLAGLMTITCRMALGGAGALTGILVILSSIGIGLLAHYYLKAYENPLTISNLYIFGLVVHLVMIALMFFMPEGVRLYVVMQIGIPVMLLYPLATILVGKILSDQFEVKAIMAKLQESEEKLNTAQRIAKLGNFVWDLETGEVIWSDSLYDLYGYDKSDRIDREKIKTKLHHPDDVERINQWLKDCISSGNGVLTPNEYRVIRKDGEIIDVYTTGIIEHREGKTQKVFATIQDISDMKRYEKKLHDTLLRQNMAVKAANVGLWDWDLVTNKVHYSSEWKRQIGYEDHEISDDLEEWRKRVHPDDLESTLEQVQRSIAEIRQGHMTEFRFRHKDGSYRWILAQGSIIQDESGRAVRMIGSHVDITEYKLAKETIKEHEKKYRGLFENSTDFVFTLDLKGNFTDVNKAAEELTGYTKNELIGMNYKDYIPDDTHENISKAFKRIYNEDKPLKDFPLEVRIKDGSTRFFETCVSPLRKGEEIVGLQGSSRDISDRIRMEEELKKSVSQYRILIENLPQKIFLKDRRSVYLLCNEKYARDLKIKSEEIFGKTDNDFYSRELAEKYRFDDQRLMEENKIEDFEEQYVLDEEERWVHTIKVPVKDGKGDVTGILGIFWDITEEKRLKEQFLQAQKMEAIGVLAGGVAHDFNNILTTIIGNAQLAQINMEKDDLLYESIEEIKKAGERGSRLTSQLLAFSRKQIIQPTMLNLNDIITNMEKMIGRLIGEDVKLLMNLEPKLFPVKMDKGQIEQVIMNLVVNAKDAMPEGGKLIIETANMVLSGDYFSKHSIIGYSGNYVMLSVSDNGIGMDKEIQKHIFEPFYSTKEKGKGTGLGLSTVYGIIKQNNGFIWVYSEPGQGSVFKVYFPRIKADADSEKIEQQPEGVIGGSETVLLVEDDDGLRKLLQGILNKKGYKVLAAENGEDALRISGTHDGSIDLILTDVVMPKMSGKKVVERLQRLYPHVKVIYMSGYTDDAIVHHGVLEPGINFIEKPFATEKLARKIREVLDDK